MSLYLGTTEITNIDNLVPQTGLDITDLWFGSTNVYTVWATYEGTLPATLNANGSDLRQYQVWGNVGGVGDKTVNLFDGTYVKGFVGTTYIYRNKGTSANSAVIPCKPSTTYTIKKYDESNRFAIGTSNVLPYDGMQLTGVYYADTATEYTFTTGSSAHYMVVYISTGTEQAEPRLMVFEGSTPPASFVPFGYKLDMGAKSGNIYNTDETSWSADGTILNDAGKPIYLEGSHYTTNFIPVEPGEAYYLAGSLANETRWRVYFYDSNKNWIRRTGSKAPRGTRLIAMDENASYFQLQVGTDIVSTADWNFVHSLTAPEKYQPYSNTTTPVYIGDEPLEKDEYVDFGEQKVYRMINGVLTPTDPPVTLPALPTAEGETVVDYAGQSVAPEKAIFKYRKEGY